MKTFKLILLAAVLLFATRSHATVMEDDYSAQYVCSGASAYTIDFPFLEKSHIVVTRWPNADPTDVTTLVQDAGSAPSFSVTVINGGESGTVNLTYGTTCTTGYTLRIIRSIPKTQEISFRSQSGFFPKQHEYALDKVTMLIQQAEAGISASSETQDALNDHIGSSDDHTNYLYLPGRSGGQTGYGGTGAGDDLTLNSTMHATKGSVFLGGNACTIDEVNSRVGINDTSPSYDLDVTGDIYASDDLWCIGEIYGSALASGNLTMHSTSNATKGQVQIADVLYADQVNDRVGINDMTPSYDLDVTGDIQVSDDLFVVGEVYGGETSGGELDIFSTSHATKGDINLGTDTLVVEEQNDRVGINDDTPSYSLDVTGTCRCTSNTYADTYLWVGTRAYSPEVYGGSSSGDDLVIESTSDATKGDIDLGGGTLFVDETNSRVGVNDVTPSVALEVVGDVLASGNIEAYPGDFYGSPLYGSGAAGANLELYSTSNATKGHIYIGGAGPVVVDVNEISGHVGIGESSYANTTLNVNGDAVINDTVYGSYLADGDLILRGTEHSTRTASFVFFGDSSTYIADAGDMVINPTLTVPTIYGGAGVGADLTLISTSNASKGDVILGAQLYADGVNDRVGINDATPSYDLDVTGDAQVTLDLIVGDDIYGGTGASDGLEIYSTTNATKGVVNIADELYVSEVSSKVAIGTSTINSTAELNVNGSIVAGYTVYGGTAANESLWLVGTTNATRTTSYVILGNGTAYVTNTGGYYGASYNASGNIVAGGDITLDGTLYGGDGASEDLNIASTSNATKGDIILGTNGIVLDETNNIVGIATTPVSGTALNVNGDIIAGDTLFGGTAVDADLVLSSTTNGDKDKIYLGSAQTSAYDEQNNRLGVGTNSPNYTLHVVGTQYNSSTIWANGTITTSDDLNVSNDAVIGLSLETPVLIGGDATGEDLAIYSNLVGDGDITFGKLQTSKYDDAGDRWYLGSVDSKYTATLNVIEAQNSDYAAYIGNENNNALAWGLNIQAGLNTPSSNSDVIWVMLTDGDGGDLSVIEYTTSTPYARFAAASDARLKENIEDTDVQGLAVINAIPLRQFDWKDDERPHQDIGYVAQEVEDVYPPLVGTHPKTGMKTVGDAVLTPVLVKSVQELSAMVEALQAEVDELRTNCVQAAPAGSCNDSYCTIDTSY